jgi:hypothetical protein
VTISPWYSWPDFLKVPMLAMSLLLDVRARDHRGLDGDLQAEGDRRRTHLGAGAQRRMEAARLSCLARNGRSPGEEGLAAPLRHSRSRPSRPLARSSHQRPRGSLGATAVEEKDVADSVCTLQEAVSIGRRKGNRRAEIGGQIRAVQTSLHSALHLVRTRSTEVARIASEAPRQNVPRSPCQ